MIHGISLHLYYSNYIPIQPGIRREWVRPPMLVLMLTHYGQGSLFIKDGASYPVDEEEHSLFLLTPDIERYVTADGGPLEVLGCGIVLEFADGRDIFSEYQADTLRITGTERNELAKLIHELHALNPPKSRSERTTLEFLSFRISGIVSRHLIPRESKPPAGERCRKAVEYLERHFREETPLDNLAVLCGMSRTLFFRTFLKETGKTPGEFRTAMRIRESQKLLLRQELRLAEIASALGWESSFYFSRIFKRETGLSPREFRRRNFLM